MPSALNRPENRNPQENLQQSHKYSPEAFDPIYPVDATTRRRLKLMLVDAETGDRADLKQVKLTRSPAN